MKNTAIILLLFSPFIFAHHQTTSTQDDTLLIPDMTAPPVIDATGDDACWQQVAWQTIDQVWIPWGGSVPAGDYSGRYKAVWSSETNLLYFLVEVVDDIAVDGFIPGVTEGNYNFDMIEVFIDENRSGGLHVFDGTGSTGRDWGTNAENAFSYHISADFPPDGTVTTDFYVGDIAGTGWGNRKSPNYIDHFPQIAMRKDGNLYTREFSLKVYTDTYKDNNPEASRIKLTTGKLMGLSLAVCDNDDPGEKPAERDNFFGSVRVPEPEYNDHWKNADGYGAVLLTAGPHTRVERGNNVKTPAVFAFPNPAEGTVFVDWAGAYMGELDVSIYNITGQTVFQGRCFKNRQRFKAAFSISGLKAGVYFLRLTASHHILVQKFVKINR